MKRLGKLLFLFLIAVLFSGCSGKRYSMTLSQPKTDFKHPGTVLILCQDKRPFVLSGEKNSSYIGRKFNGVGIPVNTYTRSGKTLPEEIGEKIGASLADNGFYVKVTMLPLLADFDAADAPFNPDRYDRIIFLTINMFRAESFVEVDFLWDFHLKIIDDRRTVLAQAKNKGVREWNPGSIPGVTSGGAQRGINMQTDTILAELLNEPDIKQALNIEHPKKHLGLDENGDIITRADGTAEKADIIAMRRKLNAVEVAGLLKKLDTDDRTAFVNNAKEIYRKGVLNEKDLDFLAEILWKKKDHRDRATVSGLGYLCKVFMKSKNPRYKSFFEQLRKEGKTRRLRKYAIKTKNRLSFGIVRQFEPGKKEKDSRDTELKQQKLNT
ncbi:hypothetical protein DGMP_30820 [Desulfomarina profundi]|uniref:Lipoprotein n=1 Tax=Desulfomarina profundi TaxID=2772557 RepID=A0A8D5JI81_9BACT|nr:hypothetical protein [Desulfomarina profundi]BCL62389.1 hypothetical protein DGMP_30820 [Desulfomarina profundi]